MIIYFRPTTNAIMSLTVANYLIQPFFPECAIPDNAKILMAAVFIMFLTWLNCYSIKVTTKLQGVFMFTKVAALIIVIIVGLVAFGQGIYLLIAFETFFKKLNNSAKDYVDFNNHLFNFYFRKRV